MTAERTAAFESRGSRMVYTDTGGAGTVFVLVHGLGMGRSALEPLAHELAESGRVVAVDLPGFGDSPKPRRAPALPDAGDLLAEFVRSLGVADPVLVGHSMGTEVVVEAVARHPAISSRIVLVAPTVNPAERTVRRQALRMAQDLADESPLVLARGAVAYARAGLRWFLLSLGAMLRHPVEETLPHVQARTLVLRGAEDRVCPRAWVAEVARLVPGAVLREVPGRGHETMIRDPRPA